MEMHLRDLLQGNIQQGKCFMHLLDTKEKLPGDDSKTLFDEELRFEPLFEI